MKKSGYIYTLVAAFFLALVPQELRITTSVDETTLISSQLPSWPYLLLLILLFSIVLACSIVITARVRHAKLTWPLFVVLALVVVRLASNVLFPSWFWEIWGFDIVMRNLAIWNMLMSWLMIALVLLACILVIRHIRQEKRQSEEPPQE
ncbi:MAG: hypothetical protein FWE40_01090 [Oscillospiraceae bacterium]|nr:hypothetical protein [Oscillospiraceae bacterium]